MKKFHEIDRINFAGKFMTLVADGRSYEIPIAAISQRLADASDAQRNFYRVAPSGYGIHWPELDEDLTVDGLINASTSTYTTTPTNALLREGEPPRS